MKVKLIFPLKISDTSVPKEGDCKRIFMAQAIVHVHLILNSFHNHCKSSRIESSSYQFSVFASSILSSIHVCSIPPFYA